ncbi:MAG: hypothetical protein ABW154_12465 [Dyella sp.]
MSFILSTAEQHAATALFARILDAPHRLLALDHADSEDLLEQLRVMARHSGQAIYLWRSGSGMSSLRDMHVMIPHCQRLGSALRYIQQSQHFGVYLLQGIEPPLASLDMLALHQLARAVSTHLLRIVLLDAPVQVIDQLGDAVTSLRVDEPDSQRPRLRDGRWLL